MTCGEHCKKCETYAEKRQEVRVVDPTTGGEKGSKRARYDLIPAEFEHALAEHYGKGAEKYKDRNWERGYKWSLSYAALRRHLNAWWNGEDNDPETGSNHLIAVAWHAIAMYIFQIRGLGTDDRKAGGKEKAHVPEVGSKGFNNEWTDLNKWANDYNAKKEQERAIQKDRVPSAPNAWPTDPYGPGRLAPSPYAAKLRGQLAEDTYQARLKGEEAA